MRRAALLPVILSALLLGPARAQEPEPTPMARGLAAMKRQDWKDAIAAFDAVIESAPTHVEAFFQRGIARLRSGDSGQAVIDLTRVTFLRPTHAPAFFERGNARMLLGDKGARADFDRAIALDPKNAGYFTQRGQYLTSIGEYTAATADLNAAVALAPKSWNARFARGCVHIFTRRPAKAIGDLDRALTLTTDAEEQAEILLYRGRAREIAKDPTGALADYDTSIAKDPTSALALGLRGRLHLQAGRLALAHADAQAALARAPRDAAALNKQVEVKLREQEQAAGLPLPAIQRLVADELYGWKPRYAVPLAVSALTKAAASAPEAAREAGLAGVSFVRAVAFSSPPHEHLILRVVACKDAASAGQFLTLQKALIAQRGAAFTKTGKYTPTPIGTPGPFDIGTGPEGWLSVLALTPASEAVKQALTATAMVLSRGRLVVHVDWIQAGAEVGQDARPLARRLAAALTKR